MDTYTLSYHAVNILHINNATRNARHSSAIADTQGAKCRKYPTVAIFELYKLGKH